MSGLGAGRLFVHLCRETGLSWAVTTSAAPETPLTCATAAKPGKGDFATLCAAAGRCEALIAWGAAKLVAALVGSCQGAGVDPGVLAGLERFWQGAAPTIEMGDLAGQPPPRKEAAADARGVAAQYWAAGTAGLLPAGAVPSLEQWALMYAFEQQRHIVCEAVAGAGKTTTLLLCARRRVKASVLLLTYNKRLQLEVSRRAAALPGSRVTVLTYHAAAGKSYGGVVQNDEAFRRVVQASPENPLRFDALMVDEAQDMSVEYFAFVRHLLRANPGAQVVVVGDARQAINEYRGARPEFLTRAAALYTPFVADRPWSACRLSVSHRLTPETAAFVNTHLYGAPVITGGNLRDRGRRPVYAVSGSKEGVTKELASAVKQAVAEFGAEGVFVLAPSVRNLSNSQSPLADLVRRHLAGIPTFVANQDDTRVDADLIRGKLAILSFNAAKGCERPCVIAVGIDETYFDYFDLTWAEPRAVPNVVTVAATRASALLIVVANARRTIRTVAFDRLGLDADIRVGGKTSPARPVVKARPLERDRKLSVSNLVRHLHPETVSAAMARVFVDPAVGGLAERLRALPAGAAAESKIRFGAFCEDLGFVYGVVAPVLAEVAREGATAFGEGLDAPTIVADVDAIRPFSSDITAEEYNAYPAQFWERVTEAALTPCADRSAAEWGRLTVARQALEAGHHHIARQVADYDWVNWDALVSTRDAILRVLEGIAGKFEVVLEPMTIGPRTVVGRADFIDEGGVVWEFKYASEYCEEHALQLACYLALRGGGEGVLFSVQRREAWTVRLEPEDALPLLTLLVEKARDAPIDIFALVERFDRGLVLPDYLTGDDAAAAAAPANFGQDDVY